MLASPYLNAFDSSMSKNSLKQSEVSPFFHRLRLMHTIPTVGAVCAEVLGGFLLPDNPFQSVPFRLVDLKESVVSVLENKYVRTVKFFYYLVRVEEQKTIIIHNSQR